MDALGQLGIVGLHVASAWEDDARVAVFAEPDQDSEDCDGMGFIIVDKSTGTISTAEASTDPATITAGMTRVNLR
jgi:hypothetical protein